MDLSVIIVNYRGWKRLKDCLDAITGYKGLYFSFEVIIVDNDSKDGLLDVFETNYPDFKFVRNKINGGFANGCNLGAGMAEGEYLLFLNPDTVARENAVAELLKMAKTNPDVSISSCSQKNEKGKESKSSGTFPRLRSITGIQRSLARSLNRHSLREENADQVQNPDWVSGSVVMIRKDNFKKINGFDEDFWMYFEDVDLCKRTRNMGGEIVLYKNIEIEHNHGGSTRINTQTTALTKNEVLISEHLYISKHIHGLEKYIIQFFLIINNVLSGLLRAFAGAILFFKPKFFVYTLVFLRLMKYYCLAFINNSWISQRSVNFRRGR